MLGKNHRDKMVNKLLASTTVLFVLLTVNIIHSPTFAAELGSKPASIKDKEASNKSQES